MDILSTIFSNLHGVMLIVGPALVILAILGKVTTKLFSVDLLQTWQRVSLALLGIAIVVPALLSIVDTTAEPTHVDEQIHTTTNIAGEWKLKLINPKHSIKGTATIQQPSGSPIFSVTGQIDNPDRGEKPLSFTSNYGMISGTIIQMIYETFSEDGMEKGVATGSLQGDYPTEFFVMYNDLIGHDINDDPKGRLTFERVAKAENSSP